MPIRHLVVGLEEGALNEAFERRSVEAVTYGLQFLLRKDIQVGPCLHFGHSLSIAKTEPMVLCRVRQRVYDTFGHIHVVEMFGNMFHQLLWSKKHVFIWYCNDRFESPILVKLLELLEILVVDCHGAGKLRCRRFSEVRWSHDSHPCRQAKLIPLGCSSVHALVQVIWGLDPGRQLGHRASHGVQDNCFAQILRT